MALYPIRNMGAVGIVKDRDPYDLPPNGFSAGLNISVNDGAIAKSVGYNSVSGLSDVVYGAGWPNSTFNYHLYAKSDGSIYRWDGALTAFDSGITNTGNGYFQHCLVGDNIILNNGIDRPFTATPTDTTLLPLSNWDSTWRCEVIKPYKTYLVAVDIQKGANEYPMMVKWSSAIEPNSTAAQWDEADITSLAGENELSGSDGEILTIEELGDQMMIYTPNSIWSMQFVGGQFLFNFRKVFSGTGLASRNGVVEFEGSHFCVGIDGIYIHNGTTKRSIADKRISKALRNESADFSEIRVHKDSARKEIWVAYRTKTATSLNKAWVWSWVEDSWTNIELPGVKHLFYAPRLGDVVRFDDASDEYDVSTYTYDTISPKFREQQTNMVREDGAVDISGVTYTQNGNNYVSFIEQTAIDLDELTGQGTGSIKQLSRIYPQISGEGSVKIRVGGTNNPQGSIKWASSVDYDIKNDYKVDVRTTYRYLAIRLEQSTTGYWKLTGWDLDINPSRYRR